MRLRRPLRTACRRLAEQGVPAATLTGGTTAWTARPRHPPSGRASRPWAMERQVRLAAGSLVLAGLLAGQRRSAGAPAVRGRRRRPGLLRPDRHLRHGQILAKLPHNRPAATDLDATLVALTR
ncbi:hypothetical protein GCM10023238_09140 [Streptomyces heliomycini]